MDSIIIEGGVPLSGKVKISGAKNSCLALMASAILTEASLNLNNVPKLSDIATMSTLLGSLGLQVQNKDSRSLCLDARNISNRKAHYDIVRKMRASFLVLGPLLAREGYAKVSLPGGCAIGARAVDLHLEALRKLGAKLKLENGYVIASAPEGLIGAEIDFPFKSVGATENAIMAAALAKGRTIIRNAAREPEIGDLIDCLKKMGAEIKGKGSSTIEIEGKHRLNGSTHEVISDRIEFGTYLLAAVITKGKISLTGGQEILNTEFLNKIGEMGVMCQSTPEGLAVDATNTDLQPIKVTTEPYPGFPTDLQAQMMATLTLVKGESEINEKIFENRFMHVPELSRMGAKIKLEGTCAMVEGVDHLVGAPVIATDLRASVALVIAGLAAKGETRINRVYHLDRGYENIETKLAQCGAQIKRVQS
ncbi:MAG: UDP-N-acetylglucosamine 1-carboxyvinyltransferase [Rhodobacteraceae bacterium]|nr:UDP-N-acetylglucosamine 1-carboxyvinyltransferase [Paracoccaceae bacterium]MYF46083.1 UDP-N-acetylglucosamine 1-carboxyvinyltransferase [Paracoccaceae bacterium]MYI92275.1 UDP-N-acetylglucosamine 1-carboxyvinyltransferase [Paracoccaceae bacterium]